MRILVLSDSHGIRSNIIDAIEQQPEAKNVIFLGDGLREMEDIELMFDDRNFYCVKGNCDFASSEIHKRLEIFGGKRIYCTHGYAENVKYGLQMLFENARSDKADIVLFGHTHEPYTGYEDGMYVMNPGSISMRSYGVVDITSAGVMCINMTLR